LRCHYGAMNGRFHLPLLLPMTYHKKIHLIVGFHHTNGYECLHSSPVRSVTEAPRRTGTLRRPVDISSRSENPYRATAPNGALLATTDWKFHHTPPLPAPFGRTLSSVAPDAPAVAQLGWPVSAAAHIMISDRGTAEVVARFC